MADQEDGDGHQEDAPDPEIERQARADGWKPKEQWNGDPDAWKPADEFVRAGQTILPIVNARLKRSNSRISELEERLEQQSQDFEHRTEVLNRTHVEIMERQKQQIQAQYGDKKRIAVAEGNVDAYDAADKAEREAIEELDKAPAEPEPKKPEADPYAGIPADMKQAFQDWIPDNKWFLNDNALSAYAGDVQAEIMRDTPGMSIVEALEETTRRTMEKFPEKFGKTNGRRAPAVEGGSRGGGSGGGSGPKKSTHDLPPEAVEAGKQYIAEGMFKTMEEYAELYWKQDEGA